MSSREIDDRRVAAELAKIGLEVSSIYDLVNTKRRYKEAIPILLKLLDEVSDEVIREGIVRALTTRDARGIAAPVLFREFRNEASALFYRWAVGNALSVVATDEHFDDLAELVASPQYGKAREMLAVALGNMKNPRAPGVAVALLKDEQVAGHALIAIGKLKDPETRSAVEPFLDHPKSWVRKEAKRALAKIDNVQR